MAGKVEGAREVGDAGRRRMRPGSSAGGSSSMVLLERRPERRARINLVDGRRRAEILLAVEGLRDDGRGTRKAAEATARVAPVLTETSAAEGCRPADRDEPLIRRIADNAD